MEVADPHASRRLPLFVKFPKAGQHLVGQRERWLRRPRTAQNGSDTAPSRQAADQGILLRSRVDFLLRLPALP